MADPQDEKKILISVNVKAEVDTISKMTLEIEKLRSKNKELSTSYAENSQEIELNKAQIKNLSTEVTKKQKLIQQDLQISNEYTGSYAKLNAEYLIAAQRAKDIAAATGVSSFKSQEASKIANDLNEKLKAIDKTVGQNTRNVGDYGIATAKLPGVFGEMQSKATEAWGTISTKLGGIKTVIKDYSTAITEKKAAEYAAKIASEEATVAESALRTAEAEGAVTAELTATAEKARAVATATATTATEASTTAMKIFKIALASTGIGLLVVALGAVVAYFASTNEGAKKFKQIFSGISAVIQEGVTIIGKYGKILFDVFTFNFTDLKTDFKAFTTEVTNSLGNVVKTYDSAKKAEEARQLLQRQERQYMSERTKMEGDYQVLVQNASKRSRLDDAGKVESAKKALKLKQDIYNYDLFYAKQNEKLTIAEQSFKSKKDLQAIEDARNRTQQVIATHKGEVNTVENLLGKAEKNETKSAKTIADAKAKKAKESFDYQKKLDEEKARFEKQLDADRTQALSLITSDYQKQQDDVFEKYQKAIDLTKKNTNLTTAEIKFYTISLQNQMMDEINSIKSKAIDDQNAHNLKVLDKENAIELAKYSDNARKILEIQLKIANKAQEKLLNTKTDGSKEQIDEQEKLLIEGENKIKGIKKQLSDLDQSTQLISVYNNEEAQYQIKLKYLNEYLKKVKNNKDEQAKTENEITILKAEHLKKQISTYSQYADDILNISGSLNTVIKNGEDAKLTTAENNNTKQTAMLDARLKAGIITQKEYDTQVARSTKKLDAEKLKIAIAQAKRDKITNTLSVIASTAKAVAEAWAASPTTFGLPWSALAAGMGIEQEAAIATAHLPEAGTGGLIGGKKHSQGGTIIEAEQGESIITAKGTSMFAPLLSAINQIGGGVPIGNKDNNIFDGGYSIRNSLSSSNNSNSDLINEIKNMKIVATIEDIKKADKNYMKIQSNGTV